jgi:hypothetical protein
MSAFEGEHMIFGLLGQANLAQNDVLQFHLNNFGVSPSASHPGVGV